MADHRSPELDAEAAARRMAAMPSMVLFASSHGHSRVRYAASVGLHAGRVRQGAIVLEDATDLEEGASVTVWVERSQEVVSVTDEELELVRRGQAEAARGECVDMRQALQRHRSAG